MFLWMEVRALENSAVMDELTMEPKGQELSCYVPGMLAMGSEDPHLFSPQQGTDLLGFFTGVFERAMRRWLA